MNYYALIFVVLILFAVTDFIAPKDEKFHRRMYQAAFGLTFFFCVIKYLFGPDILIYYNFYETIPSPTDFITGRQGIQKFEVGFNYFCSIIKHLGVSYWGMTVIVACLYFYVLHKCFDKIPSKKCLALLVLVAFDRDLIFIQHRQCMAVSFYILMFFAYIDKKYIQMTLYALLTMWFHKSGMVFVLPVFALLFSSFKVNRRSYFTCIALLLVLGLLPWQNIILTLMRSLPIKANVVNSVAYHLGQYATFQSILIVYVMLLLLQSLVEMKDRLFVKMGVVILLGWIAVLLFYQYPPMQARFRSYLTPFLVMYVFNIFHYFGDDSKVEVDKILTSSSYSLVLRDIFAGLFMLYTLYHIYAGVAAVNRLNSNLYESSTIIDLLHTPKKEIVDDRLKRARQYWGTEKDR